MCFLCTQCNSTLLTLILIGYPDMTKSQPVKIPWKETRDPEQDKQQLLELLKKAKSSKLRGNRLQSLNADQSRLLSKDQNSTQLDNPRSPMSFFFGTMHAVKYFNEQMCELKVGLFKGVIKCKDTFIAIGSDVAVQR